MPISGLIAATLAGLLGGAHCLAMCGGFVTAFSGSQATPLLPARALAWRELPYNLGRVTTYTALGALVGVTGGAALSAADWLIAQRTLYVVANLFLLGLAFAIVSNGNGIARRCSALGAALFALRAARRAATARARRCDCALRARHDLGSRSLRPRLRRAADRPLRRRRVAGRAGDAGVRHRHAPQSSCRRLDRGTRAFVVRFAHRAIRGGVAARGVRAASASVARYSARSRRCTARSASDAICRVAPARPVRLQSAAMTDFTAPCRPARFPDAREAAPAEHCSHTLAAESLTAASRQRADALDNEIQRPSGAAASLRRCGAGRPVRQCAVGRGDASSVAAARCGVGGRSFHATRRPLAVAVRAADRHRDRRRERGDGRRASGRARMMLARSPRFSRSMARLRGSRTIALSNALVAAEAIDLSRLSELFAWEEAPCRRRDGRPRRTR